MKPANRRTPAKFTARRRTALVVAVVCLLVLSGGAYKLMKSTSLQLFGGLTDRVDTPRKVVALTFDDGPTCPDVDAVLAATQGTPATFYLIGDNIERCPDGAKRLVASGAEIGNHTWDHRHMVFLTPGEVTAEIEPTDQLIRASGYVGEVTFRPPYGKKLAVLPWWLRQHDRQTIMWDVSAERWDGTPQDAQAIARETVAAVQPGSIILLHPWNGRTQTQAAIPLVIAQLREQGYTFVTVSELRRG